MPSAVRRLFLALAGVCAGLVAAEVAFSVRDQGAFPHVNFYVPDDALGARLAPGASERISFGGNPVTTIATNDQGYRAPAWPAPGAGEVVVVGDSQVFGLGVEADGTMPAQLAGHSKRTVLNGGVPTYGPDEYLAVAAEIIESRGGAVSDLVLVLNFSNDLFEVERPNRERHAIWDGWAVRIETAPEDVAPFPGRSWLMSQSHLVFGLRRWLHTPEPASAGGLPSEGTLADVVATADTVHQTRVAVSDAVQQQRQEQAQAYQQAASKVTRVEDEELLELLTQLGYSDEGAERDAAAVRAVQADSSVGDIVSIGYGEASRSTEVTAGLLRRGAQLRGRLRQAIEQSLRNMNPRAAARYRENIPALQTIPPELVTEQLTEALWSTPFDTVLDRAAALGAEHGVAVTVVTLPLDVQVLPSQFAKYGAEPQDMSGSTQLLSDVADAARRRGMRAVDPTEALRAVGDAAFLQGDLHMTAAGHDAVAAAVSAALAAPMLRRPGTGLPEGRTRVPLLEEFTAAGENTVRGSSRNRCATYQVREWFHMRCRTDQRDPLVGVALGDAPTETFGELGDGLLVLWIPLLPGRDADVDVLWADRQERLQLRWPESGLPELRFEPLADRPATPVVEGRIGAAVGCVGEGCEAGRRVWLSECPEGAAHAGSAGHCLPLCSAAQPCQRGVCSPWQGGEVCL